MKFSQILIAAIWLLSSSAAAKGEDVMIEDFGASAENRWVYFADTVMGGISRGGVEFLTENGNPYLRLTGAVSTANNGGFIQARASLSNSLNEETKGLRLRVRGNGERYYIHIRTNGTRVPWQYYQLDFPTTSGWNDVVLPFRSFKPSGSFMRKALNPSKIRTIGIVAYGRDHAAELEVDSVVIY